MGWLHPLSVAQQGRGEGTSAVIARRFPGWLSLWEEPSAQRALDVIRGLKLELPQGQLRRQWSGFCYR